MVHSATLANTVTGRVLLRVIHTTSGTGTCTTITAISTENALIRILAILFVACGIELSICPYDLFPAEQSNSLKYGNLL
jgi:uncharacterized membrane protein YukC